MKAAVVFSGSGPIVILTSHDNFEDSDLVERLARKGITKFIAFPIPLDEVRRKYGKHFEIARHDLHETDDLRVIDFNGPRAIELLPFGRLGEPIYHDGAEVTSEPNGEDIA